MVRTVETSPLNVRAELGAIDTDSRTVDLVFSTGAPVDRYDYSAGRYFVETLSLDPSAVRLDRLNAGASVLDTHSGYSLRSVIGAVVRGSVTIEKARRLVGRLLMSARDEVAPILADIRDGIIRFGSVGYRVYQYRDTGKKDGRGWPILEAIDWEPFEVSFVPIPADINSQTRADDPGARISVPVIADGGAPVSSERSTMGNENNHQPPAPAPIPDPAPAPAPAPVDASRSAVAVPLAATLAEIRSVMTAARVPSVRAFDMAAELMQRNASIDQVRAAVLDELARISDDTQNRPPAIEFGADAHDKFSRGATAAILMRSAPTVRQAIAQASKSAELGGHFAGMLDENPGEYRGMSLIDLARASLEFHGIKTRGLDKMTLVGRAFTMRRDLGGAMTPSDFPTLLENVLGKQLLAQFAIVPDTWSKWAKRGTVSDFRASGRYRMGTFGTLPLVQGGEFKTLTLSDAEKASITAATRGGIVTVNRQLIVNDDLGALSDLLAMLGRAAALSVEVDAYSILTSNSGLGLAINGGDTLFHANRSNIGTNAALSAAALDADAAVMAAQTTVGGHEYANLEPAILIVPRALKGQALAINAAEFDPDNIANKAQNRPNVARGIVREVIGTPRVTGTRRYLLADPMIAAVGEVAFLEGQTAPVLETRDGWRVDGAELRARFDYGVAAIEGRAGVTNAGA